MNGGATGGPVWCIGTFGKTPHGASEWGRRVALTTVRRSFLRQDDGRVQDDRKVRHVPTQLQFPVVSGISNPNLKRKSPFWAEWEAARAASATDAGGQVRPPQQSRGRGNDRSG